MDRKNEITVDLEWKKAVQSFRSGDKRGALFIFKKLARNGRPEACVEIANIYEVGGGGVDKSYLHAKEWYERAIQMTDDPKAYLALGDMYFFGRGVSQDYREAYYYFSCLKDENEPGAFFALGFMSEKGLGVQMNLNEALHFYRKAIALGHILALTRSGLVELKMRKYVAGLRTYFVGSVRGIAAILKNPDDRRLRIK